VRTLRDQTEARGDHRLGWDGTSDAGSALPGGVYFCRLRLGTEEVTQKVVMTPE
jgi:flagellar hook assembly protein FlgD